MTATSADAALAQLRWRYATKKFDPARRIDATTWKHLEDALVLAPSSYGLQPWRFVIVTNPELRTRLREASWNQPQITDASHLVVFCAKTGATAAEADRWAKRVAEVRQVPPESLEDYRKMMAGSISRQTPEQIDAWLSRQVYIALGVFLTTAAMIGVDACPMEGFDNGKYDEMLKLKERGYTSVVLATAGYRADDPYAKTPKARYKQTDVLEHIA